MRVNARQNGAMTSTDMVMPLPLTEEQINSLQDTDYTTEIPIEAMQFPGFNLPPDVKVTGIPIIPGITDISYVRFLHANPYAPPVDIYVNGRKVASNLAYRDFTEYMRVFPGFYRVAVFAAGTTEDPVLVTRLNVMKDRIYTVAVIGTADAPSVEVITDRKRNLNPNRSYIRFIQLSPNAPKMDVYVDDRLVLKDLDYEEGSRYLGLEPGEHSITLKCTALEPECTLLKDPSAVLKGGNAYAVYIVGDINNPPGLQVLIPLEGTSYLKF